MAKRMRSATDPLLNKLYRNTKAERERKTKILGKSYAICKECGPLGVERFYLVVVTTKDNKHVHEASPYCKSCSKRFLPSHGDAKREQYKNNRIPKEKEKYATDSEYREKVVEGSRTSQQYCRDNLTDGYIRKRIKEKTGLSLDKITIPMIIKKREEIKERRERIARGEIKKGTAYTSIMNKRYSDQLTDAFMRRTIKARGYKGEITNKMIVEEREKLKKLRKKRKQKELS